MTRPTKPYSALDAHQLADSRLRSRQIGKALYVAFEAVTREPVPSEFLELFKQLDERERASAIPNASKR